MNSRRILRRKVRLHRKRREQNGSRAGGNSTGRVPHVARLLAMAWRFEQLIQEGVVPDYAQLARLAKVSRARVTQIMNLRLLAPDIQEVILFLPPSQSRRDPLSERELRPIVAQHDWGRQRCLWAQISERRGLNE